MVLIYAQQPAVLSRAIVMTAGFAVLCFKITSLYFWLLFSFSCVLSDNSWYISVLSVLEFYICEHCAQL